MVHNIEFEKFDYFKYLHSVVNKDTAIEQQVTRRKATGNKAFNVNERWYLVKG